MNAKDIKRIREAFEKSDQAWADVHDLMDSPQDEHHQQIIVHIQNILRDLSKIEEQLNLVKNQRAK